MAERHTIRSLATRNVGRLDAALRWVGGTAALLAALFTRQPAAYSFLELLAALLLIGTALTRACPVYQLLGRRTSAPASSERPQR